MTTSTNNNKSKKVYHVVDLETQVKKIYKDLEEIKSMLKILLAQNNK